MPVSGGCISALTRVLNGGRSIICIEYEAALNTLMHHTAVRVQQEHAWLITGVPIRAIEADFEARKELNQLAALLLDFGLFKSGGSLFVGTTIDLESLFGPHLSISPQSCLVALEDAAKPESVAPRALLGYVETSTDTVELPASQAASERQKSHIRWWEAMMGSTEWQRF